MDTRVSHEVRNNRKTLKVWIKTWDMLHEIYKVTKEPKVNIVHRLVKAEFEKYKNKNKQE